MNSITVAFNARFRRPGTVAVRAKLAKKETVSPDDLSMRLQGTSIEGQKEMFRRDARARICRYLRVGREVTS